MTDEAAQHRQAAAEALERGDTRAANEAYQAELQALSSGGAEAEQDDAYDSGDEDEDLGEDLDEDSENEQDESLEFSGPEIPVPVEFTDAVYNAFREKFGSDQAALLQSKWGDKALHNDQVVRAFVQDHPRLDQLYAEHEGDDGGMALEGVALFLEEIATRAGLEDTETLLRGFPEIGAIVTENSDDRTLSPVGLYQLVAYLGKRSGHVYTHRGIRR